MKRVTLAVFLVIIFSTLVVYAAPLKKDLTVSKGVSGWNVIPRMAVNQDSGDILVTWTQQIVGTKNVRIWVRLLKRKDDGNYVLKPARMASASTGWNANSHVVYVPWKNRYVVFWDTFDFTQGLAKSQIKARMVNTKGKPVKSVITVVDDNRANNWPRAVVLDGQTTLGPAKERKEVYLTWTAFPTSKGDKDAGLVSMRLSAGFKGTSDKEVIFPVKINAFASPPNFGFTDLDAGVYTTDIQPHRNWFTVAFEKQTDGTRYDPNEMQPMAAYLGWVTPEDSGKSPEWFSMGQDTGGGTLIPNPTNGDDVIGSFGNTRSSLFVRGSFDAEFQDDVFNGDLDGYLLIGNAASGSIDGAYLPRNYDNEMCTTRDADLPLMRNSPEKGVNAAKTTIGYWVYSAGNNIKTQQMQFKKNGKIVVKKTSQNRVFHAGKLAWLTAEGIFDTGAVAIAWQRNVSASSREIRMHLFD